MSMSCSMNTSVSLRRSHSPRTRSIMRQRSSGPMPAVGSSSSSTLGSSASAMAISSSFWSPCERIAASTFGDVGQADQLHHLIGALAHAGRRKATGEIAPLPDMGGDGGHQILRHRHGRKAARHLERATDAAMHAFGAGETADILTVEQHLAGIGRERAADQVEEGAFAGAVRADHRRQRPRRKIQRHVVDRPHAAERFCEIFDLELHRARPGQASLRKSSTPRRRPRMNARITMPSTSP